MKDYCAEYEQYLASQKKVSANTLQSYRRDIHQYLDFLVSKSLTPLTATSEAAAKFLSNLEEIGRSQASITRMIASIRSYYQFLMILGVTDRNIMQGIHAKKAEKKLPETLTGKEVNLLLMQPDVTELKGCRDKAMLELLYATGIRVSELIDLNVTDVNIQVGIVYLHSDKAERIVPLYPNAVKAVADYLNRCRSIILAGQEQNALFTNMNGQRLTRQGFWKIIKTYTKQANIQKDISPHTLRHSFATHLLENGAQLKDVQEMLGHADISSTQVYSQLLKKKYQDVYNKYHPKARKA